MLVFKHLFYYHILLKVKVVEVTTQYFSRSKKHILEIPIPLMKMAYIMLVFWKKSLSFWVSRNQVWVIVCKMEGFLNQRCSKPSRDPTSIILFAMAAEESNIFIVGNFQVCLPVL